jgi:hypothetical protein
MRVCEIMLLTYISSRQLEREPLASRVHGHRYVIWRAHALPRSYADTDGRRLHFKQRIRKEDEG